jgi:ribulose-phosphate 3-epimerase
MGRVIPTVFSRNRKEFDERFRKVVGISKKIQIDFMDGKFVKVKGISLDIVPNLKNFRAEFEAHLMVEDPENWIAGLKKKGFDKVIFHYESIKNLEEMRRLAFLIKQKRMMPMIAFNPKTRIDKIIDVLEKAYDFQDILLMGVNPGKEGQKLDPNVFRRIKKIKRFSPRIKIQIDGGVNDKTIGRLSKAGADLVNSGSFVSDTERPRIALKRLDKEFKKGKI